MLSDHDIILRLFGDRQEKWTLSGAYHSYLQLSFAFVLWVKSVLRFLVQVGVTILIVRTFIVIYWFTAMTLLGSFRFTDYLHLNQDWHDDSTTNY